MAEFGTESCYNTVNTEYNAVAKLDATHVVVAYRDSGGDGYGCARQGTVSGTTISSYDTEQTFNSAVTVYNAVASLSATDYIVVYKDDGGSDYGCARVWGTSAGWSAGIIIGVSSPARVMGVEAANIGKIIGV